MAIEAEIMLALRGHLVAFAQAKTLPIAFNNKDFPPKGSDGIQPPKPAKFLRETFLPNGVAQRLIKAKHQRLQGIYQVDVMWPSGDGETGPLTIASELAAHFTTDEHLTNGSTRVQITERPAIAGLMIEDARSMIPISIRWSAWTS